MFACSARVQYISKLYCPQVKSLEQAVVVNIAGDACALAASNGRFTTSTANAPLSYAEPPDYLLDCIVIVYNWQGYFGGGDC